jgi:3-dehydroquinate synthase
MDGIRLSDRVDLFPRAPELITSSVVRREGYPVHITRQPQVAVRRLVGEIGDRRVGLITDDRVAVLHAERLARQLREHGLRVALKSFPHGEASKNLGTAGDLLDWLASTSLVRRDVVLAVGGGVVIDTVGWVASAYMRGVPYVNVPTTLLAQVDAALGGKVAVDHRTAKNLIGSFYQPRAVVSNVGYLSTLDRRHASAGLAEAIKKGVIASPDLFELIDRRLVDILDGNLDALEELVRGASIVKCELIARDPYEEDLRRPLNFGHTIGHAVETVTGHGPVLHGEAVAFGMAVAASIAESRGLLDQIVHDRVVGLLRRAGLPTKIGDFGVPIDAEAVVAALGQIRKIRDGRLRFVLPVDLGETIIADNVTDDEIRCGIRAPQQVGDPA